MASATPSKSLPVESARILPCDQTTGLNSYCCGAGQLESIVLFSAYPAMRPSVLIWVATPFTPPSRSSTAILPPCQTNGTHGVGEGLKPIASHPQKSSVVESLPETSSASPAE